MRRPLIALIVLLLATGCIQEAKWTWTGDTPGGDVIADQVTADGKGEVSPSDVPGGLDTDAPTLMDATDITVPMDADIVEPVDTTDTLDSTDLDTVPIDTIEVDVCVPGCEGKDCGDDGCGGSCGDCVGAQEECQEGSCICVPNCEGKQCGDDGCGGDCGECGGDQEECQEGLCVCIPECAGKECGDDGCGGSCGDCVRAQEECQEGACVCVLDCFGKNCGGDGCGGSCGECPGFQDECQEGVCVCQPDCDGMECGDDGCNGDCGTCLAFSNCSDGTCLWTWQITTLAENCILNEQIGEASVRENGSVDIVFKKINEGGTHSIKYGQAYNGSFTEIAVVGASIPYTVVTATIVSKGSLAHLGVYYALTNNTQQTFLYKTYSAPSGQGVSNPNAPVGPSQYSAMAVDSLGHTHLATRYFVNAYAKGVRYAVFDGQVWSQPALIDSNLDAGQYVDIAVDSVNQPHITYSDSANLDLHYTTGVGQGQVLDSAGGVGTYTSIAVDSMDKIHITYIGAGQLRYQTNKSGQWVMEELQSGNGCTSVALDSNDNIHIAFGSGQVRYVTNVTGEWTVSTVDSGSCPRLGLDLQDRPHIVYTVPGTGTYPEWGDLRYATPDEL